jgi:hypothetical protein
MAPWKLFLLAVKLRRGWQRIPPEQRRKLVADARKQARKHGPKAAKRIGAAVRQARGRR